jgi:hypothetical protein
MDVVEQRLPITKTGLVSQLLDRFLGGVVGLASKHLTGSYSRLKVTVAAFILSVLTTFPLYNAQPSSGSVLSQVWALKTANPLARIPAHLKDRDWYLTHDRPNAGQASHADKMELRVTLPILGWLTHTGTRTVIVWNHIAGFGTLFLLAGLASEALMDSVAGALFVIGLAPTFFGSWFFNDFTIGDGVAFFFMLLSVTWRSPWLSGLTFLAAAFCDERCVIALPLLLCYITIRFQGPEGRKRRRYSYVAFAAAILAWVIVRWWLGHTFGLSTGTSLMMTRDIVRYQLNESIPAAFLDIFRASWLLVGFALLSLVAERRWLFAGVLTASLGAAILPAFLVWDFQRSVAYSFVVLLISLYFLRGDRTVSRKYLAAILLVNTLVLVPGRSVLRVVFWR